jgi:triacylglycerol lipase
MRASFLVRSAVVLAAVALVACSPDMTGPDLQSNRVAATVPVRNPVLFIHGWNSTGATWFTTIDKFKASGYTDAELYNWTYYSGQSNVTTARQIAAKVDSILAITGAQKVDLVTHSMGSISARYYTKNLRGAAKVEALVSLGGTNHGTNTAYLCLQTSCIEMRPNSSFLKSLNRSDETAGSTRYATWRSPCDEVINPLSSPSLSGAVSNTVTACMNHSQLHEDPTVYAQYEAFIQ